MITIRKMVQADGDAVTGILARWNMAPQKPSPEVPDPERSAIHVANTFVACDDGTIVGVASYIEHSAELAETASLAIDPRWKGRGIGYRLQEARLREMAGKGYKTVRSETDRPETIAFYTKNFGYRVIGVNPKKHRFSRPDVDYWTVLELDLEAYEKKQPEPGK